jgi:hypothetical protein
VTQACKRKEKKEREKKEKKEEKNNKERIRPRGLIVSHVIIYWDNVGQHVFITTK